MINIIIADDHRIFIDGIKTVLANVPDIKITGEALNGKQVLSLLKTKPADVVLLDIRMPVMDGLETAKTIKEKFCDIKTIILSQYNNNGFVKNAIKYGCSGYLLKDCSKHELANAIRTVYNGGIYFNTKNQKQTESNKFEIVILSPREKEVLKLIIKENSSGAIAKKLKISIHSVKTYRERLKTKAGVNKSEALIYWAMKNNLIE